VWKRREEAANISVKLAETVTMSGEGEVSAYKRQERNATHERKLQAYSNLKFDELTARCFRPSFRMCAVVMVWSKQRCMVGGHLRQSVPTQCCGLDSKCKNLAHKEEALWNGTYNAQPHVCLCTPSSPCTDPFK
jgi:hypothetical protein